MNSDGVDLHKHEKRGKKKKKKKKNENASVGESILSKTDTLKNALVKSPIQIKL